MSGQPSATNLPLIICWDLSVRQKPKTHGCLTDQRFLDSLFDPVEQASSSDLPTKPSYSSNISSLQAVNSRQLQAASTTLNPTRTPARLLAPAFFFFLFFFSSFFPFRNCFGRSRSATTRELIAADIPFRPHDHLCLNRNLSSWSRPFNLPQQRQDDAQQLSWCGTIGLWQRSRSPKLMHGVKVQ
ncbi:uncharacterized protein LY79DRAFT_269343 [Colletotrichum navitas]|uniref:Uncharacterized protein n=1 Tax=Colletotrichum navitas TaxID=681940 RepID=A0AAD8PWI6_9PEZI|nr:uncharacterized protein LY79DRAFT_269343 [Colletotrichum navitas]KAK1585299.1 hypothetical protein LY79DRAFT_269343 [Colletotrichum navitas]